MVMGASSTPSGLEGLDRVLNGGFKPGSTVMLEGEPGTGKTTLAMQFLYEGAFRRNEPGMYITFEELPDQLYEEMGEFGWDLRKLERENRLRVVCVQPELFLEEMREADGLFDRWVGEIGCKRVAIDSITLLRYLSDNAREARTSFYQLRNALRKHGLTSLLIAERAGADAGEVPYEHYICDGVIRLGMRPFKEHFRFRTLEVVKMRGVRFEEGEHLFRFEENGLHLVPALSMVEDKLLAPNNGSTGIPTLDSVLSGGIQHGAVFLIDTNSKANHSYVLASMLATRLKAGENALIMLSSLMTIEVVKSYLNLHGLALDPLLEDGRLVFIEHYKRQHPERFLPHLLDVSGMDNDTYHREASERLRPLIADSLQRGDRWFLFYDLNTIFTERGGDFVHRFFAEEAARCRFSGFTMLALCNFTEIGNEAASFLERTANGVIRTWVEGPYQYLQLTKSPTGRISRPYLVENRDELPMIRLI